MKWGDPIATTALIALHTGRSRKVHSAFQQIIGYVKNPDKTEGGKLVTGYACDPLMAEAQFTQAKAEHYIKDGWALDDEEAAVLHNSRKGTFNYMISMVRDNNLPGDLTLTESAVHLFNRVWLSMAGRKKYRHLENCCTKPMETPSVSMACAESGKARSHDGIWQITPKTGTL